MSRARTLALGFAVAVSLLRLGTFPAAQGQGLSPSPDSAQGHPLPTVPDETVVPSVPNASVEAVLETARGRSHRRYVKDHDGVYRIEHRGAWVVLTNYRTDCSLSAVCDGPGKVALERVNDWNRGPLSPRAYLDARGNACLDWDLDFEGGVRTEAIVSAIDRFTGALDAFRAGGVDPLPEPSPAWRPSAAPSVADTSVLDDTRPARPDEIGEIVIAEGLTASSGTEHESAEVFVGPRTLTLVKLYPPSPLARLNDWNRGMRFSRAVLVTGQDGAPRSALIGPFEYESRTRGAVRKFVRVFADHAGRFPRFLKGEPPAETENEALARTQPPSP